MTIDTTCNSTTFLEVGASNGCGQYRPVLKIVSPSSVTPEKVFHYIVTAGALALQTTYDIIVVPQHRPEGGNRAAPRLFQKWFDKLQACSDLKEGWDSYQAAVPNPKAIATATQYLTMLEQLRFEPTRIAASVMGGVGITHRQDHRKAYVEFYNDGRVHALFSDRTPNMKTMPVIPGTANYYRFIREAREYLYG